MENQKTSVIKTSNFSNEWLNPSGKLVYYYDLVLENGDTGSVGIMNKGSEDVQVGTEINYTLSNNKIKIVRESSQTFSKPNKPTYNNYKNKNGQEQFLGYAWSYAKDLIIAGKGMEDVDELNQVARYIYDEIGTMLKSNEN